MDSELLASLKRPECYPHPVERIKAVDLGCSWVILTGAYAYKLKKPGSGLTDFSTLAAARFACDEELRLNRRLAPGVYLEVVEIRGSPAEAQIGGSGQVIGYALRLRQFRRDALASRMLNRGSLTPDLVQKLARNLARFHSASHAAHSPYFGSPGEVYRRALWHVREIERTSCRRPERRQPFALHRWIDAEFMRRRQSLQARWETGRVRECHGDLRMKKLIAVDGDLLPIGCASGDAERWSDPMRDISMLLMELLERGAPDLTLAFLNAYLEACGDYAGLPVLRFYLVDRAVERAHEHLVDARRCEPGSARERRYMRCFTHSLAFAESLTQPEARGSILTPLFTIEATVPAEELAEVDLAGRRVTPKTLERIRDAQPSRPLAAATQRVAEQPHGR